MKRDLGLVMLAMCIWGIGEGTFYYLQPLYLQELGADAVRIGAILSAYGIAMAVAHIPAGLLSDRLGRRPLLRASWLLGLIATLMMAAAPGLPLFTAGLVTYGLTLFVLTPLNSYVTAARGSWPVGRAVVFVSGSFNFGMVFGAMLGGWVSELFGLRMIFWAASAFFILSTAVIFLIRPQPVERPEPQTRQTDFLRQRGYQVYMIAVFLSSFATYLPQPFAQIFLRAEHGLSLSTIGGLTALAGLGVTVLSLVLGFVETRLAFVLAQAAVGGFAVLMWQGQSLPVFALAYFLLGGYKATRALAAAQTRSLAPSASMGLAFGVSETVGSLATILAPLLAGLLYNRQPSLVFAVSAGLLVLSILAGLRLSPRSSAALPTAAIPVTEHEAC